MYSKRHLQAILLESLVLIRPYDNIKEIRQPKDIPASWTRRLARTLCLRAKEIFGYLPSKARDTLTSARAQTTFNCCTVNNETPQVNESSRMLSLGGSLPPASPSLWRTPISVPSFGVSPTVPKLGPRPTLSRTLSPSSPLRQSKAPPTRYQTGSAILP